MAEIKGTVLIDTLQAIKARAGEPEVAKILAQLDGEGKAVFGGLISPSSWYPLDIFVDFLEADIRETASGNREVLIARSEKVIEGQLHGIYKVFVKLGSPEFVIKRISAVHSTYFRGVQIIPEIEDNRAVIKYVGFKSGHAIMGYVILGFYRKALEICGAKDVRVNFTIPISAGAEYAELIITWA
jgi:hypothetical protein